MPHAVLQDPDFLTAVQFAKALAQQIAAAELTPLLLLGGFVIADASGALQLQGRELDEAKTALEVAAPASGLDLTKSIKPIADRALPLNAALREILKQQSKDLPSLINGLVKDTQKAKASAERKLSLDALLKEEGINAALLYASSMAKESGLMSVTPELLLAGAFYATRRGEMAKRPSVVAHMASNEASIEALIAANDWTLRKTELPTQILPVADNVRQSMAEAHQDSDPFIVALNVGLQSATKLLSKKRVAYHEAGHAVISYVLRPAARITQVTIVDQDDADGFVAYDTTSPYFNFNTLNSRDAFLDRLCVCLAGRVAEQNQYGHDEIDAGATSDLADATSVAWQAITSYGLDFDFGPVNLDALSKASGASGGWLFDEAQRQLQKILKESLQRTEMLVDEHWTKIDAVATVLFEKKRLTEDDVLSIMGRVQEPTAPTTVPANLVEVVA